MSGSIVIITGPTCAGKSVLESMLVKEHGYKRAISHTTRPMRTGETNGVEYHFVTPEEFDTIQKDGLFVDYVMVHGNMYGAKKSEIVSILEGDNNAVIVVDPEGRDEILQYAEDNNIHAVPIFLTNPADVRAERFMDRVFTEVCFKINNLTGLKESFAARLAGMLSEEAHWGSSSDPEGMSFSLFDKACAYSVVTTIIIRMERRRRQWEASRLSTAQMLG